MIFPTSDLCPVVNFSTFILQQDIHYDINFPPGVITCLRFVSFWFELGFCWMAVMKSYTSRCLCFRVVVAVVGIGSHDSLENKNVGFSFFSSNFWIWIQYFRGMMVHTLFRQRLFGFKECLPGFSKDIGFPFGVSTSVRSALQYSFAGFGNLIASLSFTSIMFQYKIIQQYISASLALGMQQEWGLEDYLSSLLMELMFGFSQFLWVTIDGNLSSSIRKLPLLIVVCLSILTISRIRLWHHVIDETFYWVLLLILLQRLDKSLSLFFYNGSYPIFLVHPSDK